MMIWYLVAFLQGERPTLRQTFAGSEAEQHCYAAEDLLHRAQPFINTSCGTQAPTGLPKAVNFKGHP